MTRPDGMHLPTDRLRQYAARCGDGSSATPCKCWSPSAGPTVEATVIGQRQLHALVVTAPEPVRARFRGQNTRALLDTAARLRPHGDIHVRTAITVLRTLARRITALQTGAAEHEATIRAIVRTWRPDLLDRPGIGPINAAVALREVAGQRVGSTHRTGPSTSAGRPPVRRHWAGVIP